MGQGQSILKKHGYNLQRETDNSVVATKGDDTFLIKKIMLGRTSTNSALTSEIETLMSINHPHIVSLKNSFKGEEHNAYYIVMDYCQGGSLAAKIRKMSDSPQESQILSWIAEICVALRTIHEKGILHGRLRLENVFLTEIGTVCLGGLGTIHDNSESTQSSNNSNQLKNKFSATRNSIKILNQDQQPVTSLRVLLLYVVYQKSAKQPWRTSRRCGQAMGVAEGLERVHQGTTIGSLTGGVIGAVGGITSIVGLILAPFTLGASLIVTGVGVGVSVAGGFTAGASNITNMFNQSSDRKAVRSIIKKLEEKVNVVVAWLQAIVSILENMRSRCDSANITGSKLDESNLLKFGCRAGRGLGGVAELVRLLQVMNIGKIAAQASRVVRIAEVATGVFAGLFVAIDVFFIAMDAKELRHIRQARAQNQSSKNIQTPVRSDTMKFVHSIRGAAHNLQKVVDELRSMISVLPSLED
ncbi:uncharacterized protein LOC121948481 [Plectropomus leopardus]|uniref:uncharacterized protein LOC121948481 n=1 Tax=Plectropomus leopardus TaxID=160734 RepID=UPI001C4B48A4|nr:uncharacterized protein LOC121948481 [Plectropomus leopardus]